MLVPDKKLDRFGPSQIFPQHPKQSSLSSGGGGSPLDLKGIISTLLSLQCHSCGWLNYILMLLCYVRYLQHNDCLFNRSFQFVSQATVFDKLN